MIFPDEKTEVDSSSVHTETRHGVGLKASEAWLSVPSSHLCKHSLFHPVTPQHEKCDEAGRGPYVVSSLRSQ